MNNQSFQRLYIRTSFRELDLPTDFICSQHDRVFTGAGLAAPRHGQRVDDALTELKPEQARDLSKHLRQLEVARS